jgi:hypothetical protein
MIPTELVGQVCLLAPCHPTAGLRVRLDVGERLVIQCAVCSWPVLVLTWPASVAGERKGGR